MIKKNFVFIDARKKDRRKIRASSLESSAESESSAMETGDGNSGQVAAISSTASFKSPAVGIGEEETNGEKQVQMALKFQKKLYLFNERKKQTLLTQISISIHK